MGEDARVVLASVDASLMAPVARDAQTASTDTEQRGFGMTPALILVLFALVAGVAGETTLYMGYALGFGFCGMGMGK